MVAPLDASWVDISLFLLAEQSYHPNDRATHSSQSDHQSFAAADAGDLPAHSQKG